MDRCTFNGVAVYDGKFENEDKLIGVYNKKDDFTRGDDNISTIMSYFRNISTKCYREKSNTLYVAMHITRFPTKKVRVYKGKEIKEENFIKEYSGISEARDDLNINWVYSTKLNGKSVYVPNRDLTLVWDYNVSRVIEVYDDDKKIGAYMSMHDCMKLYKLTNREQKIFRDKGKVFSDKYNLTFVGKKVSIDEYDAEIGFSSINNNFRVPIEVYRGNSLDEADFIVKCKSMLECARKFNYSALPKRIRYCKLNGKTSYYNERLNLTFKFA